jgi:signal peptidase I
VFRLPRDPAQTWVKRVIGVPGDRVQIRDGKLWLNGVQMAVRPDNDDGDVPKFETLPDGSRHEIFERAGWGQFDDTREFQVPDGHLFVMGDNRDNSLDSRVLPSLGGVGFVPLENVVGRVDLVLASWEMDILSRPLRDWPGAIRLRRFFSRVQ